MLLSITALTAACSSDPDPLLRFHAVLNGFAAVDASVPPPGPEDASLTGFFGFADADLPDPGDAGSE
jgi:hypothetical protein